MGHALHVIGSGLPDIRVEKVGAMLAERGWTVDVLTPKAGDGWAHGEVFARGRPSLLRYGGRALVRAARPRAFDAQELWLAPLADTLGRQRYDVVHWNDLAGARGAARLAHAHGARFVVDLHENYPYNMWSTERDRGGRPARRFELSAWFRYERDVVAAADLVVVTVEEMASRLVGMHGCPPERIVVVQNAERSSDWAEAARSAAITRGLRRSDPALVYVGSCSPHRGLDVLIKALALLRTDLPGTRLSIVGTGSGIAGWQALSSSLGVDDMVDIVGPVSRSEVGGRLAAADVGVIPHHQYGQTDNTVPHKLYQHLAVGLPTLVSSCHSLERIVREAGAGEVFRAGYPAAAAAAIRRLAEPEHRDVLAAAALAAGRVGSLSWDAAQASLVAAYADWWSS